MLHFSCICSRVRCLASFLDWQFIKCLRLDSVLEDYQLHISGPVSTSNTNGLLRRCSTFRPYRKDRNWPLLARLVRIQHLYFLLRLYVKFGEIYHATFLVYDAAIRCQLSCSLISLFHRWASQNRRKLQTYKGWKRWGGISAYSKNSGNEDTVEIGQSSSRNIKDLLMIKITTSPCLSQISEMLTSQKHIYCTQRILHPLYTLTIHFCHTAQMKQVKIYILHQQLFRRELHYSSAAGKMYYNQVITVHPNRFLSSDLKANHS